MMKKIAIITCISIFWIASLSLVKSEQPLKVLVITGTHEYDQPAFNTMIYAFKGMDCTIKEMGDSPGKLFEKTEDFPYDAIVMYNFKQEMSLGHQEQFKEILRNGVGLTVIHHALAGFPGWTEYEDIIGATYVLEEQWRDDMHYPRPKWKHGVDMKIHVEDAEHPVCKGLSDFFIHDETYEGWIYHKGNHLLLSTEHESSNHQISWTRTWGGTRVFCIQLGHDEHAFGNENYRKLLRQGIMWSTERPVEDEGLLDIRDTGMVRARGPILTAPWRRDRTGHTGVLRSHIKPKSEYII